MSEDNRKKAPAGPSEKSTERPNAVEKPVEKSIEKQKDKSVPADQGKKDEAPEDKGDFEKPEDKSSTATIGNESNSDRTSIVSIADLTNTNTRIPARIVPVIQVSAGVEQGRIVSLAQYK